MLLHIQSDRFGISTTSSMGCQEQNARGLALSEFLATTELEILNKRCESEYTFCSNNKRSIIDVTMASRTLLQYLYDWHVDNQDTMSDHRQICSALRRDRPNSKRIRNRRNTNWTVYRMNRRWKAKWECGSARLTTPQTLRPN